MYLLLDHQQAQLTETSSIQTQQKENRRKRKERPSALHQSSKVQKASSERKQSPVHTPDLRTPTEMISDTQDRNPETNRIPLTEAPLQTSEMMAGLHPDQANALMAWYWAGYYTGRLSRG